MIYKNYIVENNISLLDDCRIILFYGENDGYKKDIKEKIRNKNEKCETINLVQEEIIKNKNILINEILNKSLFNKKKLFFINQANDKIIDIIEEAIESIDDEKIYIFSDQLDKKSKLRNYFEKSKICGVIPCYEDNEITIRKILTSKLVGYKGLTPNLINLIIRSTGLDRNKLNNEIEKIICCFSDKILNDEKLDQLLNITINDEFDKLKDEALKGNKINTNRLLSETVFEAENNFLYINSINIRINKLKEIQKFENYNSKIESIISQLKPPIFWKDKPIIIEQLKKWNKKKIIKALNKIYEAEIRLKSNSDISKDLIIKNLLVELCTAANAS